MTRFGSTVLTINGLLKCSIPTKCRYQVPVGGPNDSTKEAHFLSMFTELSESALLGVCPGHKGGAVHAAVVGTDNRG